MAGGVALSVVAVVVAMDAGSPEIDRGIVDGLLPGDRGESYYELRVAESVFRIPVGPVTLGDVEADSSRLLSEPRVDVPIGSRVDFEIPAERIQDRNVIAAARRHLPGAKADAIVAELLDGLVESEDPAVREALGLRSDSTEGAAAPAPPGSTSVTPEPNETASVPAEPEMSRVPEGRYWIGADEGDARFFNEQPRHRVKLEAFWIDRRAAAEHSGGRNFEDAQRHCASLGKRLPTEQEWETAMRQRVIEPATFFEWTASSYEPYPGNRTPEDEYGRGYRVLRGDLSEKSFRPERRRFMAPKLERESVGFRCARSERPGS